MPINLKNGASKKRERSPGTSTNAPVAPERGDKRAKVDSQRNAKPSPSKRKKKREARRKKKALRRQSAAAAQAGGAKPNGQNQPSTAAPVEKKKNTGRGQQQLGQDPAEKVKQQVANQPRPKRIKKPVNHTGVEVLAHHAPHKIKCKDYIFVPAGSKYITLNCKRLTLQSGRNVWKIDHTKGKGIQVPKEIYEAVIANEATTRAQRGALVAKIDKKENDEALKCLLKLFPNLPDGTSDEILKRAWQKSSGRVGRTKKLTMEQKVRLAVVAHVRHCHTSYEQRLRDAAAKNGSQRAAAREVKKIKSQIWGEVNAVVKSWQQSGAQAAQGARPTVEGRKVTLQRSANRGPTPPKTRWQQNVEQGFIITHPPIKHSQPIFVRHEERGKLDAEKSTKKMETNTKKKKLEVIIIDSDSEEDVAGVRISEPGDLNNDGVGEDNEIMEGNLKDWDAAVGNAQDWDIGEDDDEESDIDEDYFFYPDEEEDEDYVQSERGSCSDADEGGSEEEEEEEEEDKGYNGDNMGSQRVQDEREEDEIMAGSEEAMEKDEVLPAKKENKEAGSIKKEDHETACTEALSSIPEDTSPGETLPQTNLEANPDRMLQVKAKEEADKMITTIDNPVSEDKNSASVLKLEPKILGNPDEILLDLENDKEEEADMTVPEPTKIENTLEDKAHMSESPVEGNLVGNTDEMLLDLGDIRATKEEDEIMTDSILEIDTQTYQVSEVPKGETKVEVAKQLTKEEEGWEEGLRSESAKEKALRSAVEADEDEIYHDFGF